MLIRFMRPELRRDIYVFVTLPRGVPVPRGLAPILSFNEAEGVTLIVPQDLARRASFKGIYPRRMITLNVQSSLSAVGFLARIATALAEAGISVNPVSAYHHDHLFVAADRADDAMAILRGMSDGGQSIRVASDAKSLAQ
jgi:hypothetical protein